MEKREWTFRERLVIEDYELLLKIKGLRDFIELNPMFANLSFKMRMLMKFQLFYMRRYEVMLTKRMAILNIAEEEKKDIITEYLTPDKKEVKAKVKVVKVKSNKDAKVKKD